MEKDKADKSAQNGLILGLCSIAAWFIPLIGYPVTIAGIICSSQGLSSKNKKASAIAGLALSIVFLIVTLINSLLGVLINLGAI